MTLGLESFIGARLGDRYLIQSEIGKGRSGIVYKAVDNTLNRPVAVKLLYENMGDHSMLERFKREAMAAGVLNHPNIITVFDFGLSAENFAFLVLEYVDGEDLHTLLSREGRLTIARSLNIISQVCLALGHAHNHGLIHRDLKPGNVMLRQLEEFDDFVKIVDFGIAKRFDADEENAERLTLEGQVLGTPAYMSPEQCQAQALDARSDIYSLGCVFYRMLTGSPPVLGSNLIDLIQGHLNRLPMSFDEYPDVYVPRQVQRVIMQALAKRPEERQQSMFEFRLQLNSAYAAGLESLPKVYAGIKSVSAGAPSSTPGNNAQWEFDMAMKLERLGKGVTADPQEAMRWLRAAADHGHAEAQCRMALACMRADINDLPQAVEWLTKSAQQGFPNAQFALGQCYETGTGAAVNMAQAIIWYQEASRQGHPEAEAHVAKCYTRSFESGEDSVGMQTWLRGRAAGGEASSLLALAKYLSKRLDAENYREEIHNLYLEAGQKGDVEAQVTLARNYLYANNPQYFDQAYHWATMAAHQGNSEGIILRAVCLKSGYGTLADPAGAIRLLEEASAEDNDAQTVLACCLLLGDGSPRNITRGIAMLKTVAVSHPYAQWKLALCFKNGLGTTRDAREAERLLKLAAEARFPQGPLWPFAQPALNFREALQTIQTLAAVDNKQAIHWLAICHEDGLGVPKDRNYALQCYTRAAQKGYAPAVEAVSRLRAAART
ncbi:MAG TPA: serine/threonine-protein kinase [Candidatus Obscuribacterales bacterium]